MSQGEQPNPPASNKPQGDTANAVPGVASGDQQAQAGGQQAQAGGQAAPAAAGGATQTAAITGNVDAGKAVFRKCQACHSIGEGAKNKIGPELNGIVGEKVAAVDGYNFSPALKDYAQAHPAWTPAELQQWLAGPQKLVPGTKMSFPGLNKQEDIDNVIAYLASFNENGQQTGQ